MKTGDVGTELVFTVKEKVIINGITEIKIKDLTNVIKAEMIYRGYKFTSTKECIILEPKTNGKVKYIVESGDFPRECNYNTQIKLTFNDGEIYYSDDFSIIVDGVIG